MEAPYYIVPAVEAYRLLDPNEEKARLLAGKIAVNIGDPVALRLILGEDVQPLPKLYPELEATSLSTLDPMDPPLSPTMDTIDAFLDKYGKDLRPVGYIPEEPSETPETTLSKLIKEKRYREALEFINTQNLNNPQKNIYFAHQIRFLKKLIALENYKQY